MSSTLRRSVSETAWSICSSSRKYVLTASMSLYSSPGSLSLKRRYLFLGFVVGCNQEIAKIGYVEQHRRALEIETKVHALQAALFQRLGHSLLPLHLAIEQQETAAARAGDLPAARAVFQRQAVAFVDEVGREARREATLFLPGVMQQACKLV